jgi:60 kDa SS-A/Ro ribonucleoprotein
MVHPKPRGAARESLYGYLIGREVDEAALPERVRRFEAYKRDPRGEAPDVPFQMLTALELGPDAWRQIARNAGWTMTRMNLNTFARHGVFGDEALTGLIAARLRDEKAIRKARVFPYQLLMAYLMAGPDVPADVREALQDAMEIATANVPRIEGKVYIFPDVSGSMRSPVTGLRKGATSAVRCVDVAALVAASILRQNPKAEVMPFETGVVDIQLNPRDSVMTNAQKLASVGGGGTNCSAPLALLNRRKAQGDLVVYVSDNESWVDAGAGRGTATLQEWQAFLQRNPRARLACIDVQPYASTQAGEREDILNIGGFSDGVFDVLADFAAGRLASGHWVELIERIEL